MLCGVEECVGVIFQSFYAALNPACMEIYVAQVLYSVF